jgi:hypothetical protein
VTQVTGEDHKDHKAERRTQIWIAVIAALSGIVIAGIGLIGTLRATDSRVVSGPEIPGPTVTRTVTVAPTATVTETVDPNGNGSGGGSAVPTAAKTALDVNWETNARDYSNDIGLIVQFDCPPRGIPQRIWGDGVYSGLSSICTAGVHDKRISLNKGGRLLVQIREGADSYPATRKNGITSEESNGYYFSFEFLPPR